MGDGLSDLVLRLVSLSIHLMPRPSDGEELRGLFGGPVLLPRDETLLIIGDGPDNLLDGWAILIGAAGCSCWSVFSTALITFVFLLSKRKPLQLTHLKQYLQS